MEFWAALAGAIVGALAGGGVTWVVSRDQWKRQRREAFMEEFLVLVSDLETFYVSGNRSASEGELIRVGMMLDYYAPQVSRSAWRIIRITQEASEEQLVDKAFRKIQADRLHEALGEYRSKMRGALGVKAAS